MENKQQNREQERYSEAKRLVHSVWTNDISTFKDDYEKIQKSRIVDCVKEKQAEMQDALSKK